MADFNEQAYLAANKDVADAVARGDFKSGADHYNTYGSYEGRSGTGANSGAQVNYWDNPAYTGPVFESNEPAQSANWSSGAGYASGITAPAGSTAYYAQLQNAFGAYQSGVGLNPITGKLKSEEEGTWWNAGDGYRNYMFANPDVAMNYMVNNMAAKGVSPEQYALSNFDLSASSFGSQRGGLLPTGQVPYERISGEAGGTYYNIFGSGDNAFINKKTGKVADPSQYKNTFGSYYANTGPFVGLDNAYQRNALSGGLSNAFNSLGAGGGYGGSGGSSSYRPSSGASGSSGGYTSPSGYSAGAPSLGFNLSSISGPTNWNVSGGQLVQNQLSDIMASDNPLMQQARTRALQAMNQRGTLNSSMATNAAETAMYDAALPIAQADAGTNASASSANTGYANQFAQDANVFTRNGYMADFNLQANEWAAQQAHLRNLELARIQAAQSSTSSSQQFDQQNRQGYINGINQARTDWAEKFAALNSSNDLSPEVKSATLKSLAATYNTQIKQYAGLLGWDFDKWDIEYVVDAPASPV